PVDRGVHIFPRDLTTVVLRVPRLNQEDRTVLDPASHKSRPVARLRTVERQPDTIARPKLHIRLARIPLVRGDPRILGRIDLVQVLAPGLRDRVLPVQNRSNIVINRQPVSVTRSDLQPLAELLNTSLKTLRVHRLRRNLRDRRIRRSLNRVIQQTGVDGDTALHILIVLPQALADRFLTGTVGVTDRQPPGVLNLRDVTLNDTEHLGALIRLHPLLDLVQNHQGGPVTLQTRRRASHTLKQPTGQRGVDNRLINIKHVLRSQLLRSQSRKHPKRVLRLTLRHRSNLHPRLVVRFTNRHPVLIEMRKHDWPAKIRERYSSEQRVLTPPLAPPQHTIPVDELPMLIDGVPPHQEAALLVRRLE